MSQLIYGIKGKINIYLVMKNLTMNGSVVFTVHLVMTYEAQTAGIPLAIISPKFVPYR